MVPELQLPEKRLLYRQPVANMPPTPNAKTVPIVRFVKARRFKLALKIDSFIKMVLRSLDELLAIRRMASQVKSSDVTIGAHTGSLLEAPIPGYGDRSPSILPPPDLSATGFGRQDARRAVCEVRAPVALRNLS